MNRCAAFAAAAFGAWIAIAPESTATSEADSDGIADTQDNCWLRSNPAQDDTDGDLCGNVCDADYDQDGIVGVSDFGLFAQAFGSADQAFCHVEPIPGCSVSVDDFGRFAQQFAKPPGPSGLHPGTTACP